MAGWKRASAAADVVRARVVVVVSGGDRDDVNGERCIMSGWAAWAQNLDDLAKTYTRPASACGMVTDAELALAEHYAQFSYSGAGKIVELGCWLGAVTLALARGVAKNPQTGYKRPIEAIDQFRWEPWMTPIAKQLGCPRVPDGESFRALMEANIEPFKHFVQVREMNLLEPARIREPIEFLFVDAMKSWPLAASIVQTYLPRLTTDRSFIVHQDFAYHGVVSATNHILMWLLRDYTEPVYHAPGSWGVVFFVKQPLTRRTLPVLDRKQVTIDIAEQAWEYSHRFIRPEANRDVWLCKVLFFIEQGWLDAAWGEAQRFVSTTGSVADPAVDDVRVLAAEQSAMARSDADRQKIIDIERLLCGSS
jgi:hypothetical protein